MDNLKKIRLKNLFNKIFYENKHYNFSLASDTEPNEKNNDIDNSTKFPIYSEYDKTFNYIKVIYNALLNSDIIIRDFLLNAQGKEYKAFIIYIDGMSSSKSINESILRPLMLKNKSNSLKENNLELSEFIYNRLLPENSVEIEKTFFDIILGINSRKLCFIC